MLNRVVRCTPQGLEYEADPKQAEKLLEAMDLDGANCVATPRLKPLAEQILQEHSLAENQHTNFRARGLEQTTYRPTGRTSNIVLKKSVDGCPRRRT